MSVERYEIPTIRSKGDLMKNLEATIAVRVPANIKEKLDQISQQKDRSVSYLVRSVLSNALKGFL